MLWLLTACTHAPLGAGESRWLLVETRHFSLYTDLKRERALEDARYMERLFAGFEQSGWERSPGSELKVRLNVVMFASPRDLDRYVRDGFIGYHVPDVLHGPWIVVPGGGNREDRLHIVAHELTHYMADAAMPRQPRWFAEGLATYFETGHFTGEGRFVLGRVREGRFAEIHSLGLLRPSALLSGEIKPDDRRFYSSSWLLVHYLMTEQSAAFQEYQKELRRGVSDERAWQHAFPALTPEALDKEFAAYVLRGEYAYFELPIEEPSLDTPRERVLTRADEYALQAILWAANLREKVEQDGRRAREAIAQALSVDSEHFLANALHVAYLLHDDSARALVAAKRLCERHPERWLSWELLGEAAWKESELLPLGGPFDVSRVATMAPWQPHSWLVLATQQALRGERAQALSTSKRAQDMRPGKQDILWFRADILARMGECASMGQLVSLLESHSLSNRGREALMTIKSKCALTTQASAGSTP